MFSLFGKNKPACSYTNKVYKTLSVKRNALVSAIGGASRPVVVIFHFPAEREMMETLLRENLFSFHSTENIYPGILSEHPVLLTDAVTFGKYYADLPAVTLLIAEHHPRWSEDGKLLDAASKMHTAPEPVFFAALDEPFMLVFGGEKVAKLMTAMGMQEDENIEHDLVDKSIRKAQQKLDRRNPSPVQAESQEQWIRMNVK